MSGTPRTGAPAWLADPMQRHQYRWWDGDQWTEQVADGDRQGTDPLASGPPDRDGQSWGAAIFSADRDIRAWERGVRGERNVGDRLDDLAGRGVITLHDLRRPGTQANIDHLAITPRGIWVIDTKDDRGKVERRDVGGFLTPDVRLFVAGRDRTKVVDEVVRQAAEVRRSISEFDVPVTAAVCLTGADWSFRARPYLVDGVLVCWPRRLATLLKRRGRVSVERRERLSELLAEHFPGYAGSLSGG